MRTQNIDIQVLQNALAMFQATTKLTAEVELLQPTFGTKRRPDAMVRIAWRDMEWHFAAEIKNAVTPATLGTVVHLLNQLPEKGAVFYLPIFQLIPGYNPWRLQYFSLHC